MELTDFLFIMLNFIEHDSKDTLYLTVSLVDFFQAITESENLMMKIKFTEMTSFLCEY